MHAMDPFKFGPGNGMAFFGGMTIGFIGADLLHRRFNTVAIDTAQKDLPDGIDSSITTAAQYNEYAVDARPGWLSIGMQAGLALLGIAGGYFAPWPVVKAISFGVGFGAGVHLLAQVATAYVFEPLFADTDAGKRMFAHDQAANDKLHPSTDAKKKSGSTGDPPRTVRHAPNLPVAQQQRYPAAIASTMGAEVVTNVPALPQATIDTLLAQFSRPRAGSQPAGSGIGTMVPGAGGGGTMTTTAPPAAAAPPPATPPGTVITSVDPTLPPGSGAKQCSNDCACSSCVVGRRRRGMGEPPPESRPHPGFAALRRVA